MKKRSINLYKFTFQFAYIWHWWPGIKVPDEFLIRHLGIAANTLGLVCIKNCFLFISNENEIRESIFIYDIRENIFILSNAKILSEVMWFVRLCRYLKILLYQYLYLQFNSDMFSAMQIKEFEHVFCQRFSIFFLQTHYPWLIYLKQKKKR